MPVQTGRLLERQLASEEADIAEIVEGFLSLQARTAGPGEPLRRATHAKGVCVRAEFEVLDVAAGANPHWRRDSPGASTPGPANTPPR